MDETPARRPSPQATEVPLPADRAFVIQLRPSPQQGNELFVGRVEHIASGSVARFGSAADLLAFITKTLSAAS